MANWHAYLNISTSKSSPYEGGKAKDEARAPKGGKRWGDKPQDDSLLCENHLALHCSDCTVTHTLTQEIHFTDKRHHRPQCIYLSDGNTQVRATIPYI